MTEVIGGNWLARKPVHGRPRMRLFCFPHAGVGASAYRGWSEGLPAGIEVCPVQLPGRESRLREPPHTRIDTLVEALLPALRPYLDVPFAVFGHSMGAVVASQFTVALANSGGPQPVHLFVSGHRAPHLPPPEPPLSALSDAQFVAEIDRRYGGIPAQVLQDEELMALVLPGLRADIRALESHQPAEALVFECPVSALGGTQDTRVPREALDAWGVGVRKTFRVRVFEGGHFYLHPRRGELLADLATILEPVCTPQRD